MQALLNVPSMPSGQLMHTAGGWQSNWLPLTGLRTGCGHSVPSLNASEETQAQANSHFSLFKPTFLSPANIFAKLNSVLQHKC